MKPISEFGLCLAVLIMLPSAFAQLAPIARWDVVPYQRIDSSNNPFNVGVVAFSKEGIDRVEFDISGQGYTSGTKTATEMTYNPRTDVYEYWVPVSASEFTSDGPITIDATVYGEDGGVRNKDTDGGGLGLDPLVLNVDNGGLPQPEAWVGITGNDATGQVGKSGLPFATVQGAVEALRQWMIDNNHGDRVGGGTVYLMPGEHQMGHITSLNPIAADNEWLTITAAEGGNWENTILRSMSGSGANDYTTPQIKKIRVEGLSIRRIPFEAIIFVLHSGNIDDSFIWVDNCSVSSTDRLADPTNPNSDPTNPVWNFESMYYTDSVFSNMKFVMNGITDIGNNLARGLNIEHIGLDVFRNPGLVVNSRIYDIDPGTTQWHADAIQFMSAFSAKNVIIYGMRGEYLRNSGITHNTGYTGIDSTQDMAFVNNYFESDDLLTYPEGGGTLIYWRRSTDNLIMWHNTFYYVDGINDFIDRDNGTISFDIQPLDGGNGITNVSFVGNFFNEMKGDGILNDEGWNHNHYVRTFGLRVTPGSDVSTGDVIFDSYGRILNDSLHDRVSPLVIDIDADNNPRSDVLGGDGLGDIGAYEYQGGVECTHDSDCNDANACTGDVCDSGTCTYKNYNLDGNNNIGLGDIIQIIAYWGGSNPAADLDGNGNVGLSDIILLIGAWGEFC